MTLRMHGYPGIRFKDASRTRPTNASYHKPPRDIAAIPDSYDAGEITGAQAIREMIAKGYSDKQTREWLGY